MRIKELNYNEFKNKKYSIEITSNNYLDIKRDFFTIFIKKKTRFL